MKAAEMVKPVGDLILVKVLEKLPTVRDHVVAKVISMGTGSRIGKKIVYPNLKTGEVVVFHVPAGARCVSAKPTTSWYGEMTCSK